MSSFTKAAATEISNRATSGMTVPGHHRYAHSIATGLDFPELAENYVDEFCKQHPQFAIKTDTDIDNPFDVSGTAPMEQTYLEMNRLRGLMVPPEMWPLEVRVFRDKWETWKRGENYFDFTDLLEIAYRDISKAPNDPKVGFIDEAQDMTPLQFAIVRKWGQFMNHLFIVGDEDQTLYEFLGASPESMLEPKIDDDLIVVLSQSHRVPRAVQRWAENVIKRVEKRQPKQYRPRDVEGEVRHSVATAADPSAIFSDVSDDVKAGKTVMILASCAYMLSDVIQGLRAMGMAYHNPYRLQQGAWNPLRALRLRWRRSCGSIRLCGVMLHTDVDRGGPNRWVKYVNPPPDWKRVPRRS